MKDLAILWHLQNGECFYCGLPTWLQGEDVRKFQGKHGIATLDRARKREATREHLHRRADGGRNAFPNFLMACLGCNSERGNTPSLLHLAAKRSSTFAQK